MKTKAALLISICACVAYGLPPEVQKAIKPTNPLTIRAENRDDIWALRPGPKQLTPGYVVLDLPFEKLQSDMVQVLRDYVRSGHGVLLTTDNGCQRLFPEIISVALTTLDASSLLFTAVEGQPIESLLTSIDKVEIRSGKNRARDNDNRAPWIDICQLLLPSQNDQGTPLLGTHLRDTKKTTAFAAISYQYGSGRIITFAQPLSSLPLPQNASRLDVYDNHRFAVNADQWLAGFPIPGAASQVGGPGAGTAGGRVRDTIVLKNGDVVSGDIQDDSFTVKTSYAEVTFKRQEVSRITLEGGGANMDVLVLAVGDRLSGVLQNPQLTIALNGGGKVEIARDKIKEVVVYPRQ